MKTVTIEKLEDLESFKDYENKILRFEESVDFKIKILLKAGWSIEAGGSIEAGRWIEADEWIEAGEWIKAGWWIFSFMFDISAKSISTKKLPFWRKYWEKMPPLKNFKKQILDDKFCWDNLKVLPTQKEKEEIVAWDGWHWILRGQLECFLELKTSFQPPKEKK